MIHLTKATMLGLITVLITASPVMAQSYDLVSLYKAAANYDATLFAARSAYEAERENENIAMSRLLPLLEATASTGETNANRELTQDDNFQTDSYGVNLIQPLFDMSSWRNFSAAEISSLRAEMLYRAAEQDLILEVASAYFLVLREKENLTTAIAEEAALKRQYEQAKEQFDVGLIAITGVHEAKAQYDSSQTARILSEGSLTLAVENLSRLTGEYTPNLHVLKEDIPIKVTEYSSAESWTQAALNNNLEIKAAEFQLRSLEQDYEARKAEHYPTVNINASYEHRKFDNYAPGDNKTEDSSVFLSLNLPLFAGGGIQASVRQTRSLVEQARHELDAIKRQASLDVRTQFISLRTGAQAVESRRQNIVSRESALEATREGYNVGTRNIVEVLDAERAYFSALRDYANARIDFIESTLLVRRAAGILAVNDLERINKWLEAESGTPTP